VPPYHLADWFNRVGLVLGYGSFFLAAPEIIGEERLGRLEGFLVSGLRKFRKVLDVAIMPVLVVSLLVYPLWKLGHHQSFRDSQPDFIVWAIDIAFPLLWLSDRLLKMYVSLVSKKEGARQIALLLGAVLFTVSFILQFAATLAYFK
jgi:hypothetical protein